MFSQSLTLRGLLHLIAVGSVFVSPAGPERGNLLLAGFIEHDFQIHFSRPCKAHDELVLTQTKSNGGLLR